MQVVQTGPCRRWILLAVLFLAAGHAIAEGRNSSLKAIVEDAYKRYAWVSVFSMEKQGANGLPLKQETLSKLQEFFSHDLAAALRADSECSRKTGEICALDFDILFDSQDPEATDLVVTPVQKGRAEVCFNDQAKHRTCLLYVGVVEGGLPRIGDVVYSDGRSLRQLLGLKTIMGDDRQGLFELFRDQFQCVRGAHGSVQALRASKLPGVAGGGVPGQNPAPRHGEASTTSCCSLGCVVFT
jgi:hypothetical protein